MIECLPATGCGRSIDLGFAEPRGFEFPHRAWEVKGVLAPVIECPYGAVVGMPVAGVVKLQQKRLNIRSHGFIGIYLG